MEKYEDVYYQVMKHQLEEGIEQGIEQGIAQGTAKAKTDLVVQMLKKQMPMDMIIEFTDFTAEEITEIGKSQGLV